MCINRIFYGEDAISQIEKNAQDGSRRWLSKKEKKKVTKECLDLQYLREFPNLEVVEISGYDELQPLELLHPEVLYEFRRLKCLRLLSCCFQGELDRRGWKHLRTLEID